MEALAVHIATAGQDFQFIVNGNITIPAGVSTGYIPVTVYPDNIPELRENFTVELTGISILSVPQSSDLLPSLEGNPTDISIEENDIPYGSFRLSVAQTQVQEPSTSLPLLMTITRDNGTLGTVSVTWNLMGLTATLDQDFSGMCIIYTSHVHVFVFYDHISYFVS